MTRKISIEKERLEVLLNNAILCWYDDSFTEYCGIDDEEFINRVCDFIGISKEEYIDIMQI